MPPQAPSNPGARAVFGLDGLSALISALRDDGYRVVGPIAQGGAIVHGDVDRIEDLPAGWTETQEAGRYRLKRRDDDALFGYAVGPHSLRQHLFAPRVTLVRLRRSKDGGFVADPPEPPPAPMAILGARACDLAAASVQDRVFLDGAHADSDYTARRSGLFIVAVQCGSPGGTCFCASMGTGPRAERGFDLALTEILTGGDHRFLVEVGSDRGAGVLARIGCARPATEADIAEAEDVTARAAASMGRQTQAAEHHDLLLANLEHPRWDDVAARCLGCTNCTLVCPTCFCSTVEDTSDLAGETAERSRRWDSCFTMEHSYLAGGGPVRATLRARYRQWLTHKLATWIDQFGVSGCVGCGRCITWCPVGIDITEEVAAIRSTSATSTRIS